MLFFNHAPRPAYFLFVAHELSFERIYGGGNGGFERFARFFVHHPTARHMEFYLRNFVLHPASVVLKFQMDFCFYVVAIEIAVQAADFFLNVRYQFLIGVKMHGFDANVHHTHAKI